MEERELSTSVLGTQNYWNDFYDLEINNFNETGDQGECWFGKNLLKKVILWIKKEIDDNNLDENLKVLDVGCGNGLFLFELLELNLKNLYGIDYSLNSIKLCKIISKRDYANKIENLNFKQINILEPLEEQINEINIWQNFNLIFDKGTYDACCLNPNKMNLNEIKQNYKNFILKTLSKNGTFILCSCNWTKEELIKDFSEDKLLSLKLIDEIKQNSFKFGGSVGNSVTCLIFKKI